MITGVHTMFYSSEAEALREFIRDKLQFPFTDTGGGWLIFDLPDAELGCHPSDPAGKAGQSSGTHDISFYCDDIRMTVAELAGRGVAFLDQVSEEEYGFVTHFTMPGDVKVQLFQPKYKRDSQRQE